MQTYINENGVLRDALEFEKYRTRIRSGVEGTGSGDVDGCFSARNTLTRPSIRWSSTTSARPRTGRKYPPFCCVAHSNTIAAKDAAAFWENIKTKQIEGKGGQSRTLCIEPVNLETFSSYCILLVALRLRVEYEQECNENYPEVQFVLSERMHQKVTKWMRMLRPSRFPVISYHKTNL